MARQLTIGFEAGALQAETPDLGGLVYNNASFYSYSTAQVRSGAYSALMTGGASASYNNFFSVSNTLSASTSTIFYTRFAVYITQHASSMNLSAVTFTDGQNGAYIILDTTGTYLYDYNTGNSVASTAALPLNGWHVIELSMSMANGACVVLMDGLPLLTGTVLTPQNSYMGWRGFNQPTSTCNMYFDDLAINDSTGTSCNSWCGRGRVVMLKPVSDNSRAGFTAGASATTALYAAVNANPPAGVVLASATATSQIEDVSTNTTDYYTANMATYWAAGVPGMASIVCLAAICSFGDSTTNTLTAGISVLANPVVAEYVGTTPAAASGTWPAGWGEMGTGYAYPAANSVALNVAPTVKFRHATGLSGDDIQCCQMRLLVEFVPPLDDNITPRGMTQTIVRSALR